VFEVEVQNESAQTQSTLRFVAVPRIGEGVRLLDFDGLWGSYDVVDVWYQRSPLGDIWVPYIHVRKSGETDRFRARGRAPAGYRRTRQRRDAGVAVASRVVSR
jgi:hypothetical protein